MDGFLTRRELFQVLSAATLTAPLALAAPQPGAPLFFTPAEFTLLDALVEQIIPADDHSPGAHAAGVAAYIDKLTAEAFNPDDKSSWRKGLASVNQLSESMLGKPFLQASGPQQTSVLQTMSAQEVQGDDRLKSPAQRFFGQLKNSAVFAYYTSSVGIHQEIEYKGNVLLDKFAGYLPDESLPPISSLSAALTR